MIGTSALSFFTILFVWFFFVFSRPQKRLPILIGLSLFYLIFLNPSWFFVFFALGALNYFSSKFFQTSRHIKVLILGLNILSWIFFRSFAGTKLLGFEFVFPLGFSIFIFQQVSFLVNRNKVVVTSFSEYLLYSTFCANFATGPLWDFSEFKKQFSEKIFLRSEDLYRGGTISLIGFAKKIILAGNLALITSFLFERKGFLGNLLIPFIVNKYEMYINLLSFSEMAIGVGLMFGFRLRDNFNRPFATTSIAEFWRRWHVTLIDWIRQYVFYPLLLTPLSGLGVPFLMLCCFILFGLWHGLTFNHFIYGVIQFVLVYLDSRFGNYFKVIGNNFIAKSLTFIKWLFFYVFLISIPGVIFRAKTINEASAIFENIRMFKFANSLEILEFCHISLFSLISYVLIHELFERFIKKEKIAFHLKTAGLWLKALYLIFYLLLIIYFGKWDTLAEFNYSGF